MKYIVRLRTLDPRRSVLPDQEGSRYEKAPREEQLRHFAKIQTHFNRKQNT